ncbi:hypothetical protein L6Q79_09510 [bacterium]|nr:hypothetical protein [bacterium]NUN45245.1 hypothetical protein [bacterium]
MANRFILYLCFIVLFATACRENLVDSQDAKLERELIGHWNLTFQNPAAPGSTKFVFNDDLTVRVMFEDPTDTTANFDSMFRFVVEDNTIIYFEITNDGIGNQIGSNFIVELTHSKLVIDINRSFGKIRQVYLKTS